MDTARFAADIIREDGSLWKVGHLYAESQDDAEARFDKWRKINAPNYRINNVRRAAL
jgi:hypothetical protein